MNAVEEIQAMEAKLLRAMLSSNTDELDRLISDKAIIVGPMGNLISKADDLAAHKKGTLRISELIPQQVIIHPVPGSVIVSLVVNLRGVHQGLSFEGFFRYTRTWYREGSDWRIIVANICSLDQ